MNYLASNVVDLMKYEYVVWDLLSVSQVVRVGGRVGGP